MRIAIVGCGQLARMLALAGWEMGHHFSFLADPDEGTRCVEGLGPVVYSDQHHSSDALFEALGRPEVVTVEKEHVSVALLESLSTHCRVAPSADAIRVCQHRGREKTLLQSLDIATAPFHVVTDAASLNEAVNTVGYPAFVKSCEQGYDGQNQWLLQDSAALTALAQQMPTLPALVVEGAIRFDRELSLIVARSVSGDTVMYPLAENKHREGILLTSEVPAANISQQTQQQATDIAQRLLEHWSYVGVLSIELFDEAGVLRVNELAPRVHNSGHWSQDAGVTSQFSNHLRAITDRRPGNTIPAEYAGMINLLGREADDALLQAGDTALHWYDKSIRGRRKVGHLNLQSPQREQLRQRLNALEAALYPDGAPL